MATGLTSTEVLQQLNLSKSTFYYLLKNDFISAPTTSTGRYIWDESTVEKIKNALSEKEEQDVDEIKFKTTQINNRRYLGNKYKLLDFIKGIVQNECSEINTVADIFAGTGSVASAFSDKKLITNDLLYFNYICHIAWFSPIKYDEQKIKNLICFYNATIPQEENYMSLNFADTFFSLEDCRKIGYIRQDIEDKFNQSYHITAPRVKDWVQTAVSYFLRP